MQCNAAQLGPTFATEHHDQQREGEQKLPPRPSQKSARVIAIVAKLGAESHILPGSSLPITGRCDRQPASRRSACNISSLSASDHSVLVRRPDFGADRAVRQLRSERCSPSAALRARGERMVAADRARADIMGLARHLAAAGNSILAATTPERHRSLISRSSRPPPLGGALRRSCWRRPAARWGGRCR